MNRTIIAVLSLLLGALIGVNLIQRENTLISQLNERRRYDREIQKQKAINELCLEALYECSEIRKIIHGDSIICPTHPKTAVIEMSKGKVWVIHSHDSALFEFLPNRY